MIVVGDNLHELMEQYRIVDRDNCYDETCIRLSLGDTYFKLVPNSKKNTLIYGESIPNDCIQKYKVDEKGLILEPNTAVLACSAEKVDLPKGYMGLLQTKGSLARLFVSLHFSDGQIDSGFKGHVTFEIFNASTFNICIRKFQPVGNLYLFKTTTDNHQLYNGKYANSDVPTIQLPFR